MNNLIKRVIAYIIDMLIIILIVQSLSGVSLINKDLNKYNKAYKEYINLATNYTELKANLTKYYEDKKITEEEYNKITKYEEYNKILIKYYEDKKITEKELIKLNKEIDSYFEKEYKKVDYNIEKYSKYYIIIYIIITISYFVIFNKITDGRTVGKKLTRLKIVNTNNTSPTLINYLIRSLFLYQLSYYILRIILLNILNINSYYQVSTIISNIQLFIEIAIILMISMRFDERGIHDLIAGTKVVNVDKDGNIVENKKSIIKRKLKKEENIDTNKSI